MSPKEIEELHKSMLGNYRVGQKVRALKDLGDDPDDHSPGGVYARSGTILIVRAIEPDAHYPVCVSHEDITDDYFRVAVNEIEGVYDDE